ncbi:MAG: hypothetical protein OXQ31_02375 [Spirochaetaceae bacterium]|nr:hypothetical protein [Spirochaetaceae bacterium]
MKGAYRSIITGLAVAALVLACKETTPVTPPAPAPEDPTPPKPTLVGTWEQVTEWEDDDGHVRPVTIRLVLTESGKAFWHVDQLELSGEERHDPYGHIADWTATADTIIKTFIHDDDDDGQWESGTIDKSYYLTDSGSVLFVHHWESGETEEAFERYTRVQDPVPSNPTLLGTWEYVGVYHEHDDLLDDYVVAGKKKLTLTFTENRYILVETPRDGDAVVDYWPSSGRWNPATESSVTKTFVTERHQDDAGNWTVETRSFDKEYAWGAAGELFVTEWRGDGEDAGDAAKPYIERYTRVESPLPSLEGVWVHRSDWESGDGQVYNSRTRMTMGEEFEWLGEEGVGGAFDVSFTISGSWRHDEKRQFIIVDVRDAAISHPRFSPEDVDRWVRAHQGPLRLAYASPGVADRMMISSWHREQEDSEGFPYGGYYRPFVKQP